MSLLLSLWARSQGPQCSPGGNFFPKTEFLNSAENTQNGDAGQFDVLVETNISEAVDQIDKFSKVVKQRLVGLLIVLHPDILINTNSHH